MGGLHVVSLNMIAASTGDILNALSLGEEKMMCDKNDHRKIHLAVRRRNTPTADPTP